MLQEFMSLREDDYQKEVPDEPVTLLMENVKSGDSFTLRDSYKDVVEIWHTCVEPININK